MGGGFLYYLASNGDYHGSRGATAKKYGILDRLVTPKSRPFDPKVKHRSIPFYEVSPREGIQSFGKGFLYHLGPNGDYYDSRGALTEKSGDSGWNRDVKSRHVDPKVKHRSIALP